MLNLVKVPCLMTIELVILDNRNYMYLPETVSNNDLYKMEDEGKKQYDAYVKTVLENRTASIPA